LLLGHCRTFRWVKRPQDVIKIFHRVAQQISARLLLIGDGPDRETAERIADELGVRNRIHFAGSDQNIEELLPLLDLFLLPSEQESFGLAALEAMACGAPVIASNVGGLPELVTEGAGFLFPVRDVEGMSRKAVEILTRPELRAQPSRGGRARAKEFEREQTVDQYEAYYRKHARRRKGRKVATPAGFEPALPP
jgi:L-malate glycosyltransferase